MRILMVRYLNKVIVGLRDYYVLFEIVCAAEKYINKSTVYSSLPWTHLWLACKTYLLVLLTASLLVVYNTEKQHLLCKIILKIQDKLLKIVFYILFGVLIIWRGYGKHQFALIRGDFYIFLNNLYDAFTQFFTANRVFFSFHI